MYNIFLHCRAKLNEWKQTTVKGSILLFKVATGNVKIKSRSLALTASALNFIFTDSFINFFVIIAEGVEFI